MHATNRLLLLVALAGAGALAAPAQCHEPNLGVGIGNGDDVVLPMQALGFAFPFAGATYTDVHVSTNGFVHLSNAGLPANTGALCCSGTTAQLVLGAPKIAPYWSDLDIVAGTGSVMFQALPGKAVVTWLDAIEYGDPGANRFTVQLQLWSTGEMDFAYDGRCAIRTAGDFLVGMSGGNGAAVPAASTFAAFGWSPVDTVFEIFNGAGSPFDLAGQTVHFWPVGAAVAWLPSRCVATHTGYGSGCYSEHTSFYELFGANAFDLAGTAMTLSFTGNAYTMAPGTAAFLAPTAAAAVLPLLDDSEVTVALPAPLPVPGGAAASLTVCSNGFVSVASGNGTGFAPSSASMLNAARTGWWNWHDFDPTSPGSGHVKYEVVAGLACITWDGVHSYGTTHPETFQLQFELATGDVHFVWTTIGGFGGDFLVGYSPGGPSDDPGNRDLSASLPGTFHTAAVDQRPLQLSAAPAPLPGSTTTFTTSEIPEFAPGSGLFVAIHTISLAQVPAPGIDLAVLGAPGCNLLLASFDYSQAMVGSSASMSVSLALPATAPVGTLLYSQSAALFLPYSLPNGQNAFGLSTSNGIASHVGAW